MRVSKLVRAILSTECYKMQEKGPKTRSVSDIRISFGLNLSEIRHGRLYYLIVPKVQAILYS